MNGQLNHLMIAILLAYIRQIKDEQRLLTNEEAAGLLGVSTETLRRWRNQRPAQIEFIRLPGGEVRFERDAIRAFIERNRRTPVTRALRLA